MSRPDPNSKLSNLMLVAASRGMDQDVRRLLNQGAPFGRDWLGRSALHLAASGGHSDVIRILIVAGCDINRRDQVSCTALHRAVAADSTSAVKALLAGSCKVDLQDEHGNTALHEAAWSGYYRVVRLLVKARCNPNVRNQSGFTALHLAAQNGHVKAVQELINGAADIQALNDYGDTPLHVATRYGHLEISRRLVNAGCSLDTFNKERIAPIHIAAQAGMLQIAELLIDSGCDLLAQTKEGLTAVALANRYRNRECTRLLSRAMQALGPKSLVPPSPYGAAYLTRNEEPNVRGRTRQRHHSDESDTRGAAGDLSLAVATRNEPASSSSRRRRSGSVERNFVAGDVVRVDYPASPYFENDNSQPMGPRRYQVPVNRQWIQHRDDESQGRDSTTSASSAGASSSGRGGGGYRSSSERSKDSNGKRVKRAIPVPQSDSRRQQSLRAPPASAPAAPYRPPPPPYGATSRQSDQYSSLSPKPPRRHSADNAQSAPQSRLVDKPATIRVRHPFKGSNRPTNPFKKPPNLFFVSFEDPEPIEDACRLSDIGGRPYVPPTRNLARRIVEKRIEEEDPNPRRIESTSSTSTQDDIVRRNGSHDDGEDGDDDDDDVDEENRSVSPYVRLAENSPGDCSSPGPNSTAFLKPGCLKQNGAGSSQQKRVAFDIPAEDQKENIEERKTGDGAQATETVLLETNDDDGGDNEEKNLKSDTAAAAAAVAAAVSPTADEHGTRMAALRTRHSSLPESQQHVASRGGGGGDGGKKSKGKLSTFKALKKFVMSRHSKSALKKRMSEAAVLSLDKSGAGGSVVQSSTSLQRSSSVRQRPNNAAEGVTEAPPSNGIQRGGRHNSEVLPRSAGLFRILRNNDGGGVPPTSPARMSSSSSLNDLTEIQREILSPSSPSPPLPPQTQTQTQQQSTSSSSSTDAEQSRRESLVSGEDGADSVESPCEADKDYQVDALIAVEKARVERRCEVKTAVEVATMEKRYQTKLLEIERQCEAKAAAKEVELQAKIRQLQEQLVATKW